MPLKNEHWNAYPVILWCPNLHLLFFLQWYREQDWGLPFVSLSGSLGYARHIRNVISLSVFIKLSCSSPSIRNGSTENLPGFSRKNCLSFSNLQNAIWESSLEFQECKSRIICTPGTTTDGLCHSFSAYSFRSWYR